MSDTDTAYDLVPGSTGLGRTWPRGAAPCAPDCRPSLDTRYSASVPGNVLTAPESTRAVAVRFWGFGVWGLGFEVGDFGVGFADLGVRFGPISAPFCRRSSTQPTKSDLTACRVGA
eukprot:2505770-Rhodomonas_salina.2